MLSSSKGLVHHRSSCDHSHLVLLALEHHLTKAVLSSAWCVSCIYLGAAIKSYVKNKQPPYLRLSNMEVLVAVIDDGAVLAAGSNVANTL